MTRPLVRLSVLLIPALCALGCGGPADVSGSVTYNGKPVKTGAVTVRTADGSVFSGPIQDGNYKVTGVPSGPVTFAVASPDPGSQPATPAPGESPGRGPPAPPKPAGGGKKPTDGWFALPPKFADPDSSGQSTTLKPGPNTFPLALTDR